MKAQILLIHPDLSEVLLEADAGMLAPVSLDVEVPDGDDKTKQKNAVLDVVNGLVPIKARLWDLVDVQRQDAAAPALYAAVMDLDAIAPDVMSRMGWQRSDFKKTKAGARQGDSTVAGLAAVFADLDRSEEACDAQLMGFLRRLSQDIESEHAHWLGSREKDVDQHEDYCCDCCEKEVDKLNASDPEGDYYVDGGYGSSSDHLADCVECGKMLDVQPTKHCVESEVWHHVHYGLEFNGENADYTARRVLDILESGHHEADALRSALQDMIRRGDAEITPEQLAHITLDEKVAGAAKYPNWDLNTLREALDAGGNPNAIDVESGRPALYWACVNNDLAKISLLLERGADTEARVLPRNSYEHSQQHFRDDAGNSIIHQAIRNEEILTIVLPHISDINIKNAEGRTALYLVCKGADVFENAAGAANLLLAAGADARGLGIDAYGNALIHYAVRDSGVLDAVLPHVEDLNVQDRDGNTILHMICGGYVGFDESGQDVRIIKNLLMAGADPHITNRHGETPLSLASEDSPEYESLILGHQAALVAEKAASNAITAQHKSLE